MVDAIYSTLPMAVGKIHTTHHKAVMTEMSTEFSCMVKRVSPHRKCTSTGVNHRWPTMLECIH